MRTKHLLMAMALPTIFAACSSDELETIQNGGNALKGRVDLGNVELSFGDDAQTRMTAVGGKIDFLTGDGVGACLVDNYNGVKPEKPEDIINSYQLAPYIQTNYQYKYDGSNWTTTARMVEGNYIFYAPYNGEHLSRTPLNTGVPVVQELAMGADGKLDQFSILDAFVKSGQPAYVGYKFLKAEGQTTKVKVNLKPIFAYPLVTFTNDKTGTGEGDVTITKFVIMKTSGGFAAETPLAIKTGTGVAKADVGGIVGNLFDETEKAEDKGAWVKHGSSLLKNKTGDVTGDATKTANMITVNVPGGALKVAKGESVKFNVVLPAEESADYIIYAYLDNGNAYSKLVRNTAYSAGKVYPDTQYKPDETPHAAAATIMAWQTNSTATALGIAPNIVNTTEELVNLISSAAAPLDNIRIGSSDVKITKAVVDAANPDLTYTFADAISVDAGSNAVKLTAFAFNFNSGVTIESGDVTYEKVGAEINAVVKKGAKLTVLAASTKDANGNETYTSKVKVEAGAKAVIGSAKDNDDYIATIAQLENEGETTINVEGAVTSVTSNKGTITNESGTLPGIIKGNWVNNGDVTLSEPTTITYVAKTTTTPAIKGKLINNGSITTTTVSKDGSNVNCTLTIADGAVLDNAAEGMIINDVVDGVGVSGTLEARGLFKGNIIKAEAKITSTGGASTTTTESGRINLYSGYQAVTPFEPGSGILADVMDEYDATLGDKAPKLTDNANMLSVKKLTVVTNFDGSSKKQDSKLGLNMKSKYELQDGGTLSVNGDVQGYFEITTVGNATIAGIYNLTGDAKTINNASGGSSTNVNSTITVAENKKLTLRGISLKGNITLKGTKTGTNTKSSKYEKVSGASTDGIAGNIDSTTITED